MIIASNMAAPKWRVKHVQAVIHELKGGADRDGPAKSQGKPYNSSGNCSQKGGYKYRIYFNTLVHAESVSKILSRYWLSSRSNSTRKSLNACWTVQITTQAS